jgi:DNA-binding protein YbaB
MVCCRFAMPAALLVAWGLQTLAVGLLSSGPAVSRADEPPASTSLFNGRDLTGWQGDLAGYEVMDGEIRCKKGAGGSLLTTREFADCVLTFEFRLTPGANNGLAIRAPATGNAAFEGLELQILDDAHPKYADLQPWQVHGSIYGVVPAARDCLKPAGEWNTEEVTVEGSKVKVVVNGHGEVQSLHIDPEFHKEGPSALEPVLVAALQEAAAKARELHQSRMQSATAGFSLPGLGGL